jgi:hypothetical protein
MPKPVVQSILQRNLYAVFYNQWLLQPHAVAQIKTSLRMLLALPHRGGGASQSNRPISKTQSVTDRPQAMVCSPCDPLTRFYQQIREVESVKWRPLVPGILFDLFIVCEAAIPPKAAEKFTPVTKARVALYTYHLWQFKHANGAIFLHPCYIYVHTNGNIHSCDCK